MISQILDFARIRSGQSFELQLESADLRQFCQSVVDEFGLSRPDKEIVLSIEGRTDALFDSDRMAQVLVESDWQRDPTRDRRTDQRDSA